MLYIIELTFLWQEDVHYHLGIIHCHPITVAQAVHRQGACTANLTCLVAHAHGQSMHLRRASTLGNDKVCTDGILYAAEVYDDYIVAFLVLKAIDNGIKSLVLSCLIHYLLYY